MFHHQQHKHQHQRQHLVNWWTYLKHQHMYWELNMKGWLDLINTCRERFEWWGHIWHLARWSNVCCGHVVFDRRGEAWYLAECRQECDPSDCGIMAIGLTPPHTYTPAPDTPNTAVHWKGEKMESTFPISVHHFHSCTRCPPARARWRNREEILDNGNLKTLWYSWFNGFWQNLDKSCI